MELRDNSPTTTLPDAPEPEPAATVSEVDYLAPEGALTEAHLPTATQQGTLCLPAITDFDSYCASVVPTVNLSHSPYKPADQETLAQDYVRYLKKKAEPFLDAVQAKVDPSLAAIVDEAGRYFQERYGDLIGTPPPTLYGPLVPRPGAEVEPMSSDTLAAATPQARTFQLGSFRQKNLTSLDGQMLIVHEFAHLLSPVSMEQHHNRPEHFEKIRMGWCVGTPMDMAVLPACRYYKAVDEAAAEIDALNFAQARGHTPRPEYSHMEITLDRTREADRKLAETIRELTTGPDSLVADVQRSLRDRVVGVLSKGLEIAAGLLGFMPGRQELIEFPALASTIPGSSGSSRAVLVHAVDRLIEEHCGKDGLVAARDNICRARFLPDHGEAETVLKQSVGEESAKFLKYANHHAVVFLYAEASRLPKERCAEVRARLTEYVLGQDGRGGDI